MIIIESNANGTRFAVIANDKLLVTTSNYSYAKEVYDRAKNNELDFAEKMFVPFKFQDPKTVTL